MRPHVIDGIEELDFLESRPHDREPPVSSRTRRRPIAHKPRRGPSIWTVITPARRLDAAPAGLRASSTRQTITARPVDRTDEIDHAGHVRPAPRIEELNRAGGIEEPDDFHNRPPLETEIISPVRARG